MFQRQTQNRRMIMFILIGGITLFGQLPFGQSSSGECRANADEPPSAKVALSFRPVQKNVRFDTPSPAEYSKCRVQVEQQGKRSGWVVFGPNGQILRRYIDSNGDNVVDQWRYYQQGLEVYRDIDSNFNNKVDQSRWLNAAGSRWGIDTNEDGLIDQWKIISAEEATREAVRALALNDSRILIRLLVTANDLRTLGVTPAYSKKILDGIKSPATQLRTVLAKQTTLSAKTRWVRFNGTQPGIIPADDGKASNDLTVYENVMAIVETNKKSGLVQIGELVQVGKTWKLTQIPRPLTPNVQITAGGPLMEPAVLTAGNPLPNKPGGLTPAMQKLLTSLQQLDKNAPQPNAGPQAFAKYNTSRVAIIQQLVKRSKTEQERNQWARQLVDGLTIAIQSEQYPAGLKQLQSIEANIKKTAPRSTLLPYVIFRRLLAEYSVRLQKSAADKRGDVQKWWLKQLEQFASNYPRSADAPEAILQLAIALEFGGQVDKAKQWYRKLAITYAKTNAGQRATGAMRRLELVGKQLKLSGPNLKGGTINVTAYRGKVTLVIFWSTWCKPCTEELPQLKALYAQYRRSGFEILGVSLNMTTKPVQQYLTQHAVPWQQIHEGGGMQNNSGKNFGIISVPTMFLTDRTGKVLSRAISLETLKKELPNLLKKR